MGGQAGSGWWVREAVGGVGSVDETTGSGRRKEACWAGSCQGAWMKVLAIPTEACCWAGSWQGAWMKVLAIPQRHRAEADYHHHGCHRSWHRHEHLLRLPSECAAGCLASSRETRADNRHTTDGTATLAAPFHRPCASFALRDVLGAAPTPRRVVVLFARHLHRRRRRPSPDPRRCPEVPPTAVSAPRAALL